MIITLDRTLVDHPAFRTVIEWVKANGIDPGSVKPEVVIDTDAHELRGRSMKGELVTFPLTVPIPDILPSIDHAEHRCICGASWEVEV